MNRFSLNYINSSNNYTINDRPFINSKKYFDKNKIFYVCSSGGCGSTIIFDYLKNFGNVYHIHDRYPPNKLSYIGNDQTNEKEEVYSEWFNSVEIPKEKIQNYKIIFIYRNPIDVIYSRFAQRNGPNTNHLKNIKCDNGGNIHLFDVLISGKDLYKMEEFFDNYTLPKERNYNIYCVKYEMFWNNISLFNKVMEIPDIKELYPVKIEKPKVKQFYNRLFKIYMNLILKMNKMKFIEIINK